MTFAGILEPLTRVHCLRMNSKRKRDSIRAWAREKVVYTGKAHLYFATYTSSGILIDNS